MRFLTLLGLAAGVGGLATTATADIMAQVGPRAFDSISNTEDFESYGDFEFPGEPFDSPGGFTFDHADDLVIWPGDGVLGFPTKSLYQNGGANAMTHFTLTNGDDYNQVQFDVGTGFGVEEMNVYIRTYNNGSPTGFDFVFEGFIRPETFTVWSAGTTFDEVRVQAMVDPVLEDEAQFGAAAIDNVIAGIPSPGALALLAIAGFAPRRRRR